MHPDGDQRLYKYLRPSDNKVGKTRMSAKFEVVCEYHLPQPFLVADPSTVTNPNGGTTKGNSDAFEAFWRTEDVSIRGVFVNGEPTWGSAEYSNGMSYTGMFAGCVPHGFGEKRAGSSMYKGRFKEGMRHGRGTLLDSKNHRLYLGTFKDDLPHGDLMCVQFAWSDKHKHVTHSRRLTTFVEGIVVKSVHTDQGNVSTLSGLAHEEFLQYYRRCEKSVEDRVGKKRLRETNEPVCLWQPTGSDDYNARGKTSPEQPSAV